MVHAKTAADVQAKRKAFLAKWKLRCRPVAASLEEAGERLFTFLRDPPGQWRSLRTTMPSSGCTRSSSGGSRRNACCPAPDRRHAVLALLASGQITYARSTAGKALPSHRSARPRRLSRPTMASRSHAVQFPPTPRHDLGDDLRDVCRTQEWESSRASVRRTEHACQGSFSQKAWRGISDRTKSGPSPGRRRSCHVFAAGTSIAERARTYGSVRGALSNERPIPRGLLSQNEKAGARPALSISSLSALPSAISWGSEEPYYPGPRPGVCGVAVPTSQTLDKIIVRSRGEVPPKPRAASCHHGCQGQPAHRSNG